jgi:[calcium/calmodulin-dependent protein kinase] kinase
MKKMTHPNLIQLYEVIDNPETDKIMMIIEYAADG